VTHDVKGILVDDALLQRYPYAVAFGGITVRRSIWLMLDELNLTHGIDYLYWHNDIMFKDKSNATMYKLMQGT
jgi:hypothetical protein